MKRTLTLLMLAVLYFSYAAQAQTYPLFNTSADIDIANIRAPHLLHGDMWWDPATSIGKCEFPKGSGKAVGGVSALWMSGYTPTATLRTDAQTYRSRGTDYWPGPIDTISTTSAQIYATSQTWAKIWKINSSDIDAFLLITTHTAANTPAVILEWPAKGNPYAKGAGGVALTVSKDMAPFVDINADGIYNPLAGDYPKMKGSQMLWWVINDAGPTHAVTATNPMMMEIKMSAYAYKLGTVADNIIFYEYEVTNKSTVSYSGYRMGLMADFDIADPNDNYGGFDSGRRMGVIYSGTTFGAGSPPVAAIAMLELPGDVYKSYAPAGSFVGYVNGNSAVGDPQSAPEFNFLLHSSYRTGSWPHNGSAYSHRNEHIACDANDPHEDQRFTIASNDLNFLPGTTRKFAAALVVADSAGGCPNINFTRLNQTADTAYKLYWNSFRVVPPTTPAGIIAVRRSALRIFPNPAASMIYVEPAIAAEGRLSVYDALGRSVAPPQTRTAKGFELNTTLLPAGVYTIRYQSDATTESGIFVKK